MSIPKIIWQCGPTEFSKLPKHIRMYCDSWLEMNVKWELRYFSDKACTDYVHDVNGKEFGKRYTSIQKHEMRADIWRYLVIKQNGGFYADLDTLCVGSLDSWIDNTKTFVVSQSHYPELGEMWDQWFWGATKNHKITNEINNIVFDNVMNFAIPKNIDVLETFFPFNKIVSNYTKTDKTIQKVIPAHIMKIIHIAAHFNFENQEYWLQDKYICPQFFY